ncbi:MAG: SGNH/GDSL hydrolase family protein [Clostridia bacterium]|nr:SGNH/GDSL hydrolase family protein [Clostridia bacterium]
MLLKENERILFQGDSITDGNRGRNEDLNHIMGHGYQYIVAAKLHADNLGRNLKTYNRGIGGNRIADLYGRWKEDTLNLKPTILSILIGVNDIGAIRRDNSGSTPDRFEKIYKRLLQECLESNENMRFVLMEPFIRKNYDREDEKSIHYKENIQAYQEAVKKVAREFNAIFVPLQEVFDEASKIVPANELIWDCLHPTITGHELIARQWLRVVKEQLYK